MTVMPIFCRAMSESYQLLCHAICHLSIKMARWVLACSLYGYTCLSYYHYLIIIVTKLSSVYMVSSLHCFPHKKTLPIFIQTILYDYYTAGHFKKHDDLIWYIQAKCNLYRIFVERVVNDWNCACQVTYRVRPKNVPRQKLRFLKNRSVNLHVIFTHCKERICTYPDNTWSYLD